MASSDCSTFAIVCDNPCGLEASQLEALGVSVIPGALSSDADQVGDFTEALLSQELKRSSRSMCIQIFLTRFFGKKRLVRTILIFQAQFAW